MLARRSDDSPTPSQSPSAWRYWPVLWVFARAAPLTPEDALARAIKRSPELRAALAELESARLGVLGQDRARDWVLRASLQGQYSEQFFDTSQGGVLNSNQAIVGDVSVTTTTNVAKVGGWPSIVPSYAVAMSLGVSIAIGLLFGVGPARRAAGMDPVEALRQE